MNIRFARSIFLVFVLAFVTIAAAPIPPPEPNVTFTLITPLPDTMVIGQSYTFEVMITSDIPFKSVTARGDYSSRCVVSHGGARSGEGTSAYLTVRWTPKESTAELPGGVAPVAVDVNVRFHGGVEVSQRYEYNVIVP